MSPIVNPLEALADAIMAFEGWSAGSRSNRHRNPGNLRPVLPSQAQADGYRVFPSLIMGYGALLKDLEIKFDGQSRTGIGPQSTLGELMAVWAPASDGNAPGQYARFVAKWLAVALDRPITPETTLAEINPSRDRDGGPHA